jgi:hypothetical protein
MSFTHPLFVPLLGTRNFQLGTLFSPCRSNFPSTAAAPPSAAANTGNYCAKFYLLLAFAAVVKCFNFRCFAKGECEIDEFAEFYADCQTMGTIGSYCPFAFDDSAAHFALYRPNPQGMEKTGSLMINLRKFCNSHSHLSYQISHMAAAAATNL